MRPFKDGHILRQILFMYASKGAQEIAQAGPDAFHGVAVNFADAIAIVVSGIFPLGMTHRVMTPSRLDQMVVGRRFVRVHRSGFGRGSFDLRPNGLLLGVLTDGQTNLARSSSHYPLNRGAIVWHSAQASAIISAAARWIFCVPLERAFFARILKHLVCFRRQIGQPRLNFF